MNRILVSCGIIVTLLGASVAVSAQDGISFARWQPSGVIADGNNNEWRKPLNLYDAITGLLFSVANDSSHLYVCITANDQRKIAKLMKAGWGVSFTCKEKNKKCDASIAFPAIQMISEPGKDEGVAKIDNGEFKAQTALYRMNVNSFTATGFVGSNGNLPLQNKDGINVGVGSDSTQQIVFEIAIPFKEFFGDTRLQLNELMSMGIVVHALKRPRYHGDPDGRDLVGKGKHRNGKGGENEAFVQDRSYLFTEIDFKQKFHLSGS